MVQDISLSYQQFRNSRDNLSSWLEHLPQNQMRPGDGSSQIAYKLQAQQVRAVPGVTELGVSSQVFWRPHLPPLPGTTTCASVAL